jgi:hypothetical protein
MLSERNSLAEPTYCSPVRLSTIRYTPPAADRYATQSLWASGWATRRWVLESQMHPESRNGGNARPAGRITTDHVFREDALLIERLWLL